AQRKHGLDRVASIPGNPACAAPTSTRQETANRQPDYVVWSLFNFTAFNCCCVGFAALIFSIKSRDCKVIGDPEGAASYGRTARFLNIAALLLGIIVFLCFICPIVLVLFLQFLFLMGTITVSSVFSVF
uniref:Uncharacterized protein n=1 Tax=Varanus komodoensis TaxID=61221 RepID=A0A8D2IWS4_VARKO